MRRRWSDPEARLGGDERTAHAFREALRDSVAELPSILDAFVALLSALQVHGLTTEAPHSVWILIDRLARTPKVTYPKLEVLNARGPALVQGVETRTIEGVPVRLTTPAKTVADCFRYRRHVGLEVALAALRGYIGRPVEGGGARRAGAPIDDLVEAARADRVSSVLRPYLEALA